ncbi:A-kinase anchor protein 7-like isoform X4 [Xyrichtys novacula]|uniref:A-kinase anchor protein 7-like isoform X4 n=1 Tax=Xyrichtys novacula TaxID=13765 RepID=A0AAV1GWL1_XYRNO|nr:A-kinase anchor protein 7-like isoform X4 [Xyrichtys novacula]
MFLGCFLRSPIRSIRVSVFCLQSVFIVNENLRRRLNYKCTSVCKNFSALQPPAHLFRLKTQRTMSDIQAANISYGKEGTAVAPGDDDEEDEGETAAMAAQVYETKDEEFKKAILVAGQVDTIGMALLQDKTDTGACTVLTAPAGSNEMTKKKTRRERRTWKKKKLKSADSTNDLMSELPFCLTSPTTWKELGFSGSDSNETKRKRKRGDNEGRVDSEEDAEKKKKKKESQRPNYFISIPITNTQISSAVMEVQEAVLQQESRLAKAMIPIPTLHITLLVTHLANQEQVDLAASVLSQAEPSLAKLLGGRDLVLPFSGIGHFRKEVVFVGLAPGQHRHTLDSVAELLRSRFVEQGLLHGDGRGFEPHLTIMKLSRASKLRSQGIKRVDPALYSNYTNKFFGDQTVERVDLCSMLKKKQQDGYYHTETSLQLGGRRRSEPDEAELLRVSRRLVEDAVNRALQQYKQEALQNGGGPNAMAVKPPDNTEEADAKTDITTNATTDNRK